MDIVNVHEAKTHLSRLLERVEAGEEVVIGRAGKPIAVLRRYAAERPVRVPGRLAGRIRFRPGFDEADAAISDDFEGLSGAQP